MAPRTIPQRRPLEAPEHHDEETLSKSESDSEHQSQEWVESSGEKSDSSSEDGGPDFDKLEDGKIGAEMHAALAEVEAGQSFQVGPSVAEQARLLAPPPARTTARVRAARTTAPSPSPAGNAVVAESRPRGGTTGPRGLTVTNLRSEVIDQMVHYAGSIVPQHFFILYH